MTAVAAPLLELDAISTYYGDARILSGLSMQIAAGETVCLLGRNGRGKTTAIKSILGLAPVRQGRILLDGADITRMPTHQSKGGDHTTRNPPTCARCTRGTASSSRTARWA